MKTIIRLAVTILGVTFEWKVSKRVPKKATTTTKVTMVVEHDDLPMSYEQKMQMMQ